MRRRLVLAAAAITTTIVLAFAIPLGLLIRSVANDRALTAGRAGRPGPGAGPGQRDRRPTPSTRWSRGVDRPGGGHGVGGAGRRPRCSARRSSTTTRSPWPARSGRSFSTPVDGGRLVLVPVRSGPGRHPTDVITRVRARPPCSTRACARRGCCSGALSVALVLAVAVVVADRLARTIVAPVRDLAATAERLGQGDLEARVEPAGPPEIVEVGHVLNRLAGRIGELLAAERELVADLSHRLRTPITALRLDADGLHDAGRTRAGDRRRRRAGPGRRPAHRRGPPPGARGRGQLAATWPR